MLTLEDFEGTTDNLKALIKEQLNMEIHSVRVEQIPYLFRLIITYKNRTLVPGQVYWSHMIGYITPHGITNTYSFDNSCFKLFEDWASKVRQIKRNSAYKHELIVKTFRPSSL